MNFFLGKLIKILQTITTSYVTEIILVAVSVAAYCTISDIPPFILATGIAVNVIIIIKLIVAIAPIIFTSKKRETNLQRQDILTKLHNTTNNLIKTTIKLVSIRTFLFFLALLALSLLLKTSTNTILLECSEYVLALSTTMFTIWVIEIIYNSQMDELNAKKIDETLMKIFENREWIRRMDPEWRKTAISECLIGLFGEELGYKYAQKTIDSQLKQDTYRLSFDYVVSLKEDKACKYRLIQELSYRKRINFNKTDDHNISSVFEFIENRSYEPDDKNEIIFFKEEIRSKILKSLLRYSYDIAKHIYNKKDSLKAINIKFEDEFGKIINDICNNVVNSIIQNDRNSKVAARYRQLYIENNDIINNETLEETGTTGIEELHKIVYKNIADVKQDINNVWYNIIRVIIAQEDITSAEDLCSEIVRLLIKYKCTELDENGNLKDQTTADNDEVVFIIKTAGNKAEDVHIPDFANKYENINKSDIVGVKFVTKVKTFEKDGGIYFYARMTCDYPIYDQNTFYWKFGEPIIGTSFLMAFPSTQDMNLVHAVQYFSDNHQNVTIDKSSSTVSFYAEDLLLPESGIYIHWSKRNDNPA